MLLATALVLACGGGPPDSPEQQIRRMLSAIERASAERDLQTLKGFVSERYADRHDRTKQDLSRILTYQYLRRRSVYLLTRIERLELSTGDAATLTVLTAMAGTPLPELEAVRTLQADVYRFDLDLTREGGDWRALRAEWRPARLDDFF